MFEKTHRRDIYLFETDNCETFIFAETFILNLIASTHS